MKILICFFTELNDVQSFITLGAQFQIVAASFMNVCDCKKDFLFIIKSGLFVLFNPSL